MVDNTFLTPVAQRPIKHGADIVVYSITKFINGHSDSIGGSLAVRDDALYEELKFLQNAIGAILSPFDSWLTLRGLRTLELRIRQHNESARKIADLLHDHPKIKRVYYPGLFEGEQGAIVKRANSYFQGRLSLLSWSMKWMPSNFSVRFGTFRLPKVWVVSSR